MMRGREIVGVVDLGVDGRARAAQGRLGGDHAEELAEPVGVVARQVVALGVVAQPGELVGAGVGVDQPLPGWFPLRYLATSAGGGKAAS